MKRFLRFARCFHCFFACHSATRVAKRHSLAFANECETMTVSWRVSAKNARKNCLALREISETGNDDSTVRNLLRKFAHSDIRGVFKIFEILSSDLLLRSDFSSRDFKTFHLICNIIQIPKNLFEPFRSYCKFQVSFFNI